MLHEQKLQAAAYDVSYSMGSFRLAARLWRPLALTFDQGISEDHAGLLREVELLHARELLDFFYQVPRGDDVAASHFVPGWAPTRPQDEEVRRWINKRLAHLTYARSQEFSTWNGDRCEPKLDLSWDMEAIERHVEETWNAFLAALPSSSCAWFAPRYSSPKANDKMPYEVLPIG